MKDGQKTEAIGYANALKYPEGLLTQSILDAAWEPMSKAALIGWLAFYVIFLVQAMGEGMLKKLMDLVFVPIHEGGHALFSWLGHWPMVVGGTLLQLLVPAALACYFFLRRELPGTAFCTFFFFENFLPIAAYMADSRKQELEYVTIGDAEFAEHDWFTIFSGLGVLEHDTTIAAFVRAIGWLGMLGTVVCLVVHARNSWTRQSSPKS